MKEEHFVSIVLEQQQQKGGDSYWVWKLLISIHSYCILKQLFFKGLTTFLGKKNTTLYLTALFFDFLFLISIFPKIILHSLYKIPVALHVVIFQHITYLADMKLFF